MLKTLTIGALSRATQIKVNTVRFYEQIGLMPPAHRTDAGRRVYSDADVRRLRFIRNSRRMGFSTNEVRSLLRLEDAPQQTCDQARAIALTHQREVSGKIADLKLLEAHLVEMIARCDAGTLVHDCSILDSLAGPLKL